MELNHLSKVVEDDVVIDVFNDDRDDDKVHDRVHLVLFQVKLTTGCSTNTFAAEVKKWDGSRAICVGGKGRKKITYAGLDMQTPSHSTALINPENATFKGTAFLKGDKPNPDLKLYPVVMYNRTFIG